MRMLHLADLHLGWMPTFLAERAAARRSERDALLERAVAYALGEGRIDLVVIAGDLFETQRPDDSLAARTVANLRRLTAAGVPVVTVPGNHDEITYHDSIYRRYGGEWPGLLVTSPMPAGAGTVIAGGVPCHIYGLAYTGGLTRLPLTDFPRRTDPGLHLAVLHGSLDWDAGDRSLPLRSADLARAGYDYIALGHIHQHRQVPIGQGLAVYPGAVEGKGFSDPGVGHLTVVDLEPGAPARLETVPLAVRPVRTAVVDAGIYDDADGMAAALAALAGVPLPAIQRLHLQGVAGYAIDPDALTAALAPHFYYLEVVDDTDAIDAQTLERLAVEPTMRGLFVQRLATELAAATTESRRRVLHRAVRVGLWALAGGERP